MIYQARNGALLTVMFFLHNACLKDGHVVHLEQLPGAGRVPLQDEAHSRVLQCAQLTSISNHSSTVHDYMIGHTFPTGHKFGGMKPEMTLESGCGVGLCGAEPIVFVCCVRPAGLSVCSPPGVEKGLAVSSQP